MPFSYGYTYSSSLPVLAEGIVVLVIAFFLLKKQYSFDSRFFSALLPFVMLGATVRAFVDKGLLPYTSNPFSVGFYTHTPGLWLAGGVLLLVLLLFFRGQPRFLEFLKKTGWFLLFIALLVFFGTGFSNVPGIALVAFFFFIPFFAWILVQKKTNGSFLKDELNFFAFSTNSMDLAAGLVAFVFLHCFSKHQATGELLAVSPLFFVAAKIVFILAALWLIEKLGQNNQQKGFAKISLGLFWVMTGFRTVLVIGAGLCGFL